MFDIIAGKTKFKKKVIISVIGAIAMLDDFTTINLINVNEQDLRNEDEPLLAKRNVKKTISMINNYSKNVLKKDDNVASLDEKHSYEFDKMDSVKAVLTHTIHLSNEVKEVFEYVFNPFEYKVISLKQLS